MRLLGFLGLALICAAPAMATEPLPTETPHVLTLAPSNGQRLYVLDGAIAHGVDGRVHVIDGANFKKLGQFSNGFFGLMALSADGNSLFNATTYFARGDHGARTDVLEIYDTGTLSPRGEVLLSPHRVEGTAYPAYLVPSAAGRYVFVQGATPAASVMIIDIQRRGLLAELPTAGCFGIYASTNIAGRFSSFCGDGAAITVDFDAAGHETARRRSAKLFDPENDALFISAVAAGDRTLAMSFRGNLHSIDFSGPVASQQDPWPLVTGADIAQGWRPGGYQLMAYSETTGQLYVGMHAHGSEGSHKFAADQVWRVDVAHHAVAARGDGAGSHSWAISPGAHPTLYGLSAETGTITRFDGQTLAITGNTNALGVEAPEMLVAR